jgi:hypothetical protein
MMDKDKLRMLLVKRLMDVNTEIQMWQSEQMELQDAIYDLDNPDIEMDNRTKRLIKDIEASESESPAE